MDLRPNDAAVAAGAAEAWSEAPSEAAGDTAAPSGTKAVTDLQQTAQNEAQQRARYTGVPRSVITASYFACFCSIGVSLAALGPILLQLSTALDAEVDSLGFLFVARSAGYLCGSIAAGWLFDRVRHTHALLLGGMLLSSAGCALLPRCTSVGAAAAAVSTQGVCMGLLDTGGNCLLIWLHGPRRVEPYMQAMHGFFGLGAFASPLIIEWSIAATGGYRAALDGLSLALALAAAPLLCYVGPAKPVEEGEEAGQVAAAAPCAPAAANPNPNPNPNPSPNPNPNPDPGAAARGARGDALGAGAAQGAAGAPARRGARGGEGGGDLPPTARRQQRRALSGEAAAA